MSDQVNGEQFKALGRQLKALRSRTGESLAEASGAVEIDIQELASFELGNRRPSEDVLLLLISHFGARDDEAVRLWEMAGYASVKTASVHMANEAPAGGKADNPVLFTDIVDITVNNYGVVMNFLQNGGPNTLPSSVARVGMSREHARSVMEILQKTLAQVERQQKNS
jgi:transcriptional regulator with XRE-family HTH domain